MTTDNYSYMLETGIMGKVSKQFCKGASSKLILPTVSLHCVLVPCAGRALDPSPARPAARNSIISRAGPGLGLHTAGPGRAWAENNLNTSGLGRAWA